MWYMMCEMRSSFGKKSQNKAASETYQNAGTGSVKLEIILN